MKTIQANLRTLLLLLLCLLPELKLVSQEIRNNSISGIVVDAESDSPLPEIKIYVFSNRETILTLTSDKNGAFQMSLPDGRYTIWPKDKVFIAKPFTIEVRGDVTLGTIRMQKASDISSAGPINIRSEKKKDTPEELTAAKIEAAPVYSRRGTRVTYDVSRDPDAGKIKMSEMLSRIPDLKVAASNGKLQYEGRPLGKILINNAESGLINKSRQYPMEFIQADYMRNVEIILPGDLEYNNTEPILIINLARSLPYGFASNLTAKSTTKNAHSPSADLVANTPLIGIGLNYSYNYTGEPSLINNNERQMTDPSADFVSILSTSTNEKESSSHSFTTNFFRNFSGDNIRFNASLSTSGGNSESFSSTRVVSTKSDNTSTESLTERTSISKEPFRLNGGLRVSGSFGEPTGIKGKRKNEWKLEYSYRNTRSESEDIYSSYTQMSSYGMEEHKATGSLNLSRFINKPVHTASMALNGGMYSRQYNTLSDSPLLSSGMDYRQNVGFANLTLLGSVLDNKLGYTLMLNNEYLSNAGNFTNDAVKSPLDYRTFNINPNAGISWRFNRGQITVTYARLVRRPTISQLNPYEDRSNPFLVRKGNPNLKGEATDNITLNFTRNPNIRQIRNINLGLTYSVTNGKISRATTLDSDGRAISSFFNLGNSRAIGAKVSSTINLSKNLSTNLIASYQKITVTLPSGITNSYDSPLFDVVSTWHPKWFELTGSLMVKPSVNSVQSAKLILEPLGELSLSRYFKKQHIGVSFGIYDLFHKGGLLESEIRGNNFIQHNLVERRGRTYSLRVYWRIGRFRYTKPVEITAYDM